MNQWNYITWLCVISVQWFENKIPRTKMIQLNEICIETVVDPQEVSNINSNHFKYNIHTHIANITHLVLIISNAVIISWIVTWLYVFAGPQYACFVNEFTYIHCISHSLSLNSKDLIYVLRFWFNHLSSSFIEQKPRGKSFALHRIIAWN